MLERVLVLLAVTVACVSERSKDFACTTSDDCTADRTCDRGFCVKAPDAATAPVDASDEDAPVDADPFAVIALRCEGAGYVHVIGTGYYRAVPSDRSWLDARTDCADDVAGATHLIVLSSQTEVTYMATQLGWVGLSDRGVEGAFATVSGETGDLRPFAPGQPDNDDGSEDCIEMTSAGRLNDTECGRANRYVCECDGRPSLPE